MANFPVDNLTAKSVIVNGKNVESELNKLYPEKVVMPGFSEEEVLTEKRWIDGKPIYRRVVIEESSQKNTYVTMHTDTTVEKLVHSEIMRDGAPDDTHNQGDLDSNTALYIRSGNFDYYSTYTEGYRFICIFEYTKSTDTAESPVAILSIPSEKDIYSEEETLTNKVWKGKPVYRKLVTASHTYGDTADWQSCPYDDAPTNVETLVSGVLVGGDEDTSWRREDDVTAGRYMIGETDYRWLNNISFNKDYVFTVEIVLEYTKQ
jgi:hypothetical protein